MDWDHIMKNKARAGHFAGRGRADEDAYYLAFAGSEKRVSVTRILATARSAVAEVGAVALSALQTR